MRRFAFLVLVLIAVVAAGYVWEWWDGDDGSQPSPTQPEATPTVSDEPAAMPDIVITNVRTNPTLATAAGGQAVLAPATGYEFSVDVANQGQGGVGGNVVVSFDWGCNTSGAGTLGQTGDSVFVGPLGPGETKASAAARMTTPGGTGSCWVEFNADPDNVFAETDESDLSNQWRVELLLGG